MRNDYFTWKGTSSAAYGLIVQKQPDIIAPRERTSDVKIFGRSGVLTMLEGEDVFDDFTIGIDCAVRGLANVYEIAAWLRGSGQLILPFDAEHYYEARVNNQVSISRVISQYHQCEIVFRCQPYRYRLGVNDITLSEAGSITNPGNVTSEPIITIAATGAVALQIGAYSVAFSDVDESVTIHVPLMECYKGSTNKNRTMTGDYPKLKTGTNAISWSGNVSSITIKPRWRDI